MKMELVRGWEGGLHAVPFVADNLPLEFVAWEGWDGLLLAMVTRGNWWRSKNENGSSWGIRIVVMTYSFFGT